MLPCRHGRQPCHRNETLVSTDVDVVAVDEALLRFLVAARRSTPTSSSPTRRQLLDVAIQKFADEGYVASSMRTIAAACGIRAPSIYEHFANKRELLFAAMTDVLGDFQAFMAEVINADLNHGEQLRLLVQRHAAWQLRFPERAGAWDSLAASHTVERHLLHDEVAEFNHQRQLYLDVITSLTAEAFPGPDPAARARAMLSLGDHITSWSGPVAHRGESLVIEYAWTFARAVVSAELDNI